MKHNYKIIFVILSLFLVSQFIGLAITNHYLDDEQLPFDLERPEIENKNISFIPIFVFIIVATLLGLFLIKYKFMKVWKMWFFISIWFALTISFSAFITEKIAFGAALAFAILKVFRRGVIVHNFTEVFIYGGLAAIFVPIINTFSMIVLLVLISFYDYIAVRKTKHMIKLAKFEGESKVFAGLMIPYKKGVAILGGGDIGIPLMFAGVVMKDMALPLFGIRSLIIPFFTAAALAVLFLRGRNRKFYPAMPYLSIGCFVGYILLLLL
jgi:presenilin-like A22 family membrane protease